MMGKDAEIRGSCEPRFARVREIFERGFQSGAEVGAALCITLEGEPVVDLWGGWMDEARSREWQRDTLVNVYSTTKGITALAAHRLLDEGRLELDAPVAAYWPEFAAAGKQDITVRHVLSHRAGLVALSEKLQPEDLYDWQRMVSLLAEQKPWWEPGTAHGYHAFSFGWLVGELIRRISGRSVGTYVREEIAEPLGVEFHIGCGAALDARIADLIQGPIVVPEAVPAFVVDPESLFNRVFSNPALLAPELGNSRAWRAAELPAVNGHTHAVALARIYGALALGGEIEGVRILSAAGVERARSEHSAGRDAVLPMNTRLGLGFFLPTEDEYLGPNPRTFGHGGAGGSYSQADPENRMGFGYVTNHMHVGSWLVDPRARALLAAAYASL